MQRDLNMGNAHIELYLRCPTEPHRQLTARELDVLLPMMVAGKCERAWRNFRIDLIEQGCERAAIGVV